MSLNVISEDHRKKDMGRIEGKAAIVTGAAQGIGLAIATRFVAEGAQVLLVDRNREAVDSAAAGLAQQSATVDVSVREEVAAMVARALEAFGRIDILVNNAGVFHPASLLELTEADFDRVLAINLKSVLFATQAVAPHMIARRSGAIVNVSSVAAVLGADIALAYCVSKAGLAQLTNVTALALAPYGIRVNAIGPDTFATEMAHAAYGEEIQRQVLSRTPLGRLGQPEEAASAVLFLASDDAAYVTGKTIYVDGGRMGLNLTVPVQSESIY
jgi:NAD(P)-dependent dehydrogenase (short-subunit alcohol dehydrogenase family)